MSLSLLRSKWFIASASVASGILFAYASDRMTAEEVKKQYLAECRVLGDEPLAVDAMPKKYTILCIEPSYPEVQKTHKRFKKYALPLLNTAGIDHEWIEISRRQLCKEINDKVVILNDEEALQKQKESNSSFIKSFKFYEFFASLWSRELNGEKIAMPFTDENILMGLKESYKKPSRIDTIATDGVVILDAESEKEFKSGILDGKKRVKSIFIDLKRPLSFVQRVSQFFSNRLLMRGIGEEVMQKLIRE